MDLEQMSLIVRALHQDVSALDERLRQLEATLRRLHETRLGITDLRVIPDELSRT
jgi:hypothetical protein